MAATRLMPLHVNKGRTLSQCIRDRTDYAKNGEKTEDGIYVSSYQCDQETVTEEFMASKRMYLRSTGRGLSDRDVIAYQIRQSFKPGEITPEEANRIGYETAMRFTKGNHMFIVATHTDKAHIHNHIIYNSTNLECSRKFRDFWFSGLALQRLSDIICLENGLSVIEKKKPSERTKWEKYPNRPNHRTTIREKIDIALKENPKTFDDFLRRLESQGYEIKRGAHTAIRGNGQKRFIRFDSLDGDYTETEIKKVIAGKKDIPVNPDKKKSEKMAQTMKDYSPKGMQLAVDIQEKMAQGKNGGYIQWAKKHNVKQFAETILFLQQHDISDRKNLDELADRASGKFRTLTDTIKQCEEKMRENRKIKEHIINYSKTRDTYVSYRKSGYSNKFFEEHRSEILIHKAAKAAFSELADRKIPKVKELNAEYEMLFAEKKKAYQEYQTAKEEMKKYQIAKQNVDTFYRDFENPEQDKKEKSKTQDSR